MKNIIKDTNRHSNIEVFRIVSMLLVLLFHLNDWMLGGIMNNYAQEGLTMPIIVRFFINSIACICVPCFIFISGYFSIRPTINSLFNLFTTLLFFYIIIYALDVITGFTPFTIKGLLNSCLALSKSNWFIQCYLALLLVTPILNVFCDNVEKTKFINIILILIVFAFWFGCIRQSKNVFFEGHSPFVFIIIYLIARYVKIYGLFFSYSLYKYIFFFFISTLLMMTIALIGFNQIWFYCSPLSLLSTYLLFVIFNNTKIVNSRFVNYFSTSTLSVFIFHTTGSIFAYLLAENKILYNRYSYYTYFIISIFAILLIYVIAVSLDKVRIFLSNIIFVKINKKIITYFRDDNFLFIFKVKSNS